MTVGALHHLEFNVSDLQRSTEFWGWLLESLEYDPYLQWEAGRSWRLGDFEISFVQTDPRFLDTPYHRRRTGMNHIALRAASRAHVDEMTQRLRDRGVVILYEDTHPFAGGADYYAVFFEDPDRIKVELVAP